MPTRTIEGVEFTLLRRQRNGACLYRGPSGYLRIGPSAIMQRYNSAHRHFVENGFPVPTILSQGTDGDDAFQVEESLGNTRFLELFEEDIRVAGAISEKHFAEYMLLVDRFFIAQLNSRERPRDTAEFRRAIQIETLKHELPDCAAMIERRFAESLAAIEAFPYRIMHGDLNPANMYPRGIIDFEDTSSGPIGFDIVCAIDDAEWSPAKGDYEFVERFRFTPEQKAEFFNHFDEKFTESHLPSVSEASKHFEFFRGVWLSVGMHQWPKLQKYRYDLFIQKYLR